MSNHLAQALTPFIGAKLNPARDEAGHIAPHRALVDIITTGADMMDADVRAITTEGVSVFWYDGCTTIRWADIAEVQVATLNALGNRVAHRVVRADARVAA